MPREISASELAEKLRSASPLLLVDIREAWEREIARLPGDVHIPIEDLPRRAAELRAAEGGELVLYCHAGVRSWMAAEYLEHQEGLKDVVSLGGGIDAWSCLVDPAVPRY